MEEVLRELATDTETVIVTWSLKMVTFYQMVMTESLKVAMKPRSMNLRISGEKGLKSICLPNWTPFQLFVAMATPHSITQK